MILLGLCVFVVKYVVMGLGSVGIDMVEFFGCEDLYDVFLGLI